ncbi:hypothetical protein [uncultured Methylobacterium sp.]|uniref:hypothetical protein n=1 Tax=uncultured Methylobacterium sp. TaxID=157278 RepID=UPI00262B5015|nr:hypothetical protein [uncultured Methylobacterium sp.]
MADPGNASAHHRKGKAGNRAGLTACPEWSHIAGDAATLDRLQGIIDRNLGHWSALDFVVKRYVWRVAIEMTYGDPSLAKIQDAIASSEAIINSKIAEIKLLIKSDLNTNYEEQDLWRKMDNLSSLRIHVFAIKERQDLSC